MESEQCENMATIRRLWPGKEPDLVCIDHGEDSKRIAGAMGFYLHLESIGYSVSGPMPAEFPTCCCSKGFKTTDVVDSMKVICQKCGRQREWKEIETGKDGIVCKGGCEK